MWVVGEVTYTTAGTPQTTLSPSSQVGRTSDGPWASLRAGYFENYFETSQSPTP